MNDAHQVDTIANRIKEAMRIRNIQASELAEKTKIGKSSISHYINGTCEPKTDRIYLMSQALCVNPVWLSGFDVPIVEELPKSTSNLKIENAKILADVATNERLMAYITKLMNLSETQREFIFSNIDFILKDKE